MTDKEKSMDNKSGLQSTEFWLNSLGPYGIVFALLFGVMDQETIDLIKQAIATLPESVQAAVLLAIKLVTILGGITVGGKAVEATKGYTLGRTQLKFKAMEALAAAARAKLAAPAVAPPPEGAQ